MYLDTRSDASTANPAQDSRIVLIIIGSTILLVILVMVVIQPIRRLQYVHVHVDILEEAHHQLLQLLARNVQSRRYWSA